MQKMFGILSGLPIFAELEPENYNKTLLQAGSNPIEKTPSTSQALGVFLFVFGLTVTIAQKTKQVVQWECATTAIAQRRKSHDAHEPTTVL